MAERNPFTIVLHDGDTIIQEYTVSGRPARAVAEYKATVKIFGEGHVRLVDSAGTTVLPKATRPAPLGWDSVTA